MHRGGAHSDNFIKNIIGQEFVNSNVHQNHLIYLVLGGVLRPVVLNPG